MTEILVLTNFSEAYRSLHINGYVPHKQDGKLGHLFTKGGKEFRLVKNDISGGYDFKEVTCKS